MAASLLHHIFPSYSSRRHDNNANFSREVLDVPAPTPVTPQMHTPDSQSRSSSPSQVQPNTIPKSMVSPERFATSSDIPIDGQSTAPEVPQCQASARAYNLQVVASQNNHQLSTRYYFPTLVLQNSGSVARDHLASERTFLAYVRTSLGMASAGVGLIQLFAMSDLASKATGIPLPAVNQRVQKFATPLGLSALGMALIILLTGVFRYFWVQRSLPENRFPTARLPIVFISFGLGAIAAIVFGALLTGKVST